MLTGGKLNKLPDGLMNVYAIIYQRMADAEPLQEIDAESNWQYIKKIVEEQHEFHGEQGKILGTI
jgi:hypothetical protein